MARPQRWPLFFHPPSSPEPRVVIVRLFPDPATARLNSVGASVHHVRSNQSRPVLFAVKMIDLGLVPFGLFPSFGLAGVEISWPLALDAALLASVARLRDARDRRRL